MFLNKRPDMNKNLEELLKNKMSKEQLKLVPKSFDIVGDIIIFSDFPKELQKKEKLIANALLKIHKNIKVVAKKTKKYSGRYRLPKIKIIAGEKRKITLHKENNVLAKLNIETCYFSPRLSNERLRIAKLTKKNESILVMFSGVAIYPLVISKNSKAKEIYAVEINPEANKFAEENIKLNKINNIELFKGNVKTVLPKINKKFDSIIMPHPTNAYSYLDIAVKKIKKNGIIHLYDFSKEEDIPNSSVKKIGKKIRKFKIMNVVKCGQFAPRKYRVCVDFKIK